ncbi:MAG: hypothetical protein K1X65_15050 [Caldilineales bacterium]|nr:hypothetical protein [Caldilineales bacterium]MCW5857950.1 hypothetical protein [Caldilineales bacterium]
MKSYTRASFWKAYWALPPEVRQRAKEAYRLWRQNPAHPGLRFKQVKPNAPVYSVRIGLNHRALGLLKDDTITWFWIGSHDEYDRLLR